MVRSRQKKKDEHLLVLLENGLENLYAFAAATGVGDSSRAARLMRAALPRRLRREYKRERRTLPLPTTSIEEIEGEGSGKMRSIPTPKLTRRTGKLALLARPFFEITTPSKVWMRSLTFSPSPSIRRTCTLMVSPARNSGRSLRNCASCNF